MNANGTMKLMFGDEASIRYRDTYEQLKGAALMQWLHGFTSNKTCKDCFHLVHRGKPSVGFSTWGLCDRATARERRVLLSDFACGKFESPHPDLLDGSAPPPMLIHSG